MNIIKIMNKVPILIFFIAATCFSFHQAFASSSENYCITADVICTGGTETGTESENYYFFGTIGQSVISITLGESENYGVDAGFHYAVKATSVTPDNDGICFAEDNCFAYANGELLGTCTLITPDNKIVSTGQYCTIDADCDPGEVCEMEQADNYPPGGNGIGDACECEGDFDCDGDVDAEDVTAFLDDFGRGTYDRPCTNEEPCNGDFICDTDVDGADITKFLEDFGRGQYDRPCPVCDGSAWCVYE